MIEHYKREVSKIENENGTIQSEITELQKRIAELKRKHNSLSDDMPERRTPTSMIKPIFQGISQNGIITRVLGLAPLRRFTVAEIVEYAYLKGSSEEMRRINQSVGVALSRGLVKGRWEGGRGQYYIDIKG